MRQMRLIPNLKQVGNTLKGTIKLDDDFHESGEPIISYNFHESVNLQLVVEHKVSVRGILIKEYFKIKTKFNKLSGEDNLSYVAKFSSTALAVKTTFNTDKGIWHLISEKPQSDQIKEFDIRVSVKMFAKPSSFASLYDDVELTDFELRGLDGSVSVHRAVLAASSPVLRRMVAGPWKEAQQGHVDIPDNTQHTLQLLKDFVYLGKLPDEISPLRALLLLAKCYMITDLERLCLDQVLKRMRSSDVLGLM